MRFSVIRCVPLVAACTMWAACSGGTPQPDAGGGGGEGVAGGSGGGTGGSSGGGAAGGSVGGGGGSSGGGQAGGGTLGPDPKDDGGTFVRGDLCNRAIPIDFGTATQQSDGGLAATVVADLTQAHHDYVAVCARAAVGHDLMFAITLSEPKSLVATAQAKTGTGDAVLALLASPCSSERAVACRDANNGATAERLVVPRVAAGTWYLLLDAYRAADDTVYDLNVELGAPAPAASNDTCASAAPLAFDAGVAVATIDTTGATGSNGPNDGSRCAQLGASSPDVVYRFTLPSPQDVNIKAERSGALPLSPVVLLTSDCASNASADEIECAPRSELTRYALDAGTYFIVVDGVYGALGTADLTVTLSPPSAPPANDTCQAPVTLSPNASVTTSMEFANRDVLLSCASDAIGGDAVYQFTLTQHQRVTLTLTPGTVDDVALSLWDGSCGSGAETACMNREASGGAEVVMVNDLGPGTYFVAVQGLTGPVYDQVGLSLALSAPVTPPPHDSCAAPREVTFTNNQYVDPGVKLGDANDQYYSDGCSAGSGGDVVYRVVVPSQKTLTVNVAAAQGSMADALISARTGPCEGGTELGCVDDVGVGSAETLVLLNSEPGPVEYFIIVDDYSSPGGTVDVTVSLSQ